VNSFATLPSEAASTGVPRLAMMSSASWRRVPSRVSLKVSVNWLATTPATGISNVSAAGD